MPAPVPVFPDSRVFFFFDASDSVVFDASDFSALASSAPVLFAPVSEASFAFRRSSSSSCSSVCTSSARCSGEQSSLSVAVKVVPVPGLTLDFFLEVFCSSPLESGSPCWPSSFPCWPFAPFFFFDFRPPASSVLPFFFPVLLTFASSVPLPDAPVSPEADARFCSSSSSQPSSFVVQGSSASSGPAMPTCGREFRLLAFEWFCECS